MIPRPDDLPLAQQAWIKAQVDRAPELSESQRAGLSAIFDGGDDPPEEAECRPYAKTGTRTAIPTTTAESSLRGTGDTGHAPTTKGPVNDKRQPA